MCIYIIRVCVHSAYRALVSFCKASWGRSRAPRVLPGPFGDKGHFRAAEHVFSGAEQFLATTVFRKETDRPNLGANFTGFEYSHGRPLRKQRFQPSTSFLSQYIYACIKVQYSYI